MRDDHDLRICNWCRFWTGWRRSRCGDAPCHALPPSSRPKPGYGNMIEPVWPPTQWDDFCGSFSPAPAAIEDEREWDERAWCRPTEPAFASECVRREG